MYRYRTVINRETGLTELEQMEEFNTEGYRCTKPELVGDLVAGVCDLYKLAEEYVYSLALNTRLEPIGLCEIAHGCVNGAQCQPREVLLSALLMGATSVAVVHNHPSGDVTPSEDDHKTFYRLANAGDIVGVPVIDMIVTGKPGEYYSCKSCDVFRSEEGSTGT